MLRLFSQRQRSICVGRSPSLVPQITLTLHRSVFDHVSSRNIFHGSGAELTRGYWSMISLYNINPESVYDGQQRSFEDFQFDLENVLTFVTAVWEVS